MQKTLPYGSFTWVFNTEKPGFYDVLDDTPIGYILEVDLKYPTHIHDAHKDLPFCPEHTAPPRSKQKKLLTTLNDKNKYVIHYIAPNQALKHGALEFTQKAWLKPYNDLNSEKRKNAKNEFEKLLFKLFNNAVYGKTMENERKRVDVKLTNKWTGRYGAEALIAKPNYHNLSIFDENLVAVELSKTEIYI